MSSASSGAPLSHHASNPLDVGPHDKRNNAYKRKYHQSLAQADCLSSDDPIDAFASHNLKTYHQHLTQVIPEHPAARSMRKFTPLKHMDEDMSEDELATPMKHDIIPMGTREESHEAAHSDKDYDNDNDDQMSIDSYETDEEATINERTAEERKEIIEEINDLMESVPQLQGDYKILDRLGTGTFSSVYKALDLHYHTKWDNTPWHGHHPPSSSAHYQSALRPRDSKVFVAIKRIYVTSSPERIKNEISIMIDCLSCRHVSQLITATRCLDQVVVIMPYQRNEDFREYYRALSMPAIKSYMRCLLAALRDVHQRKVIHRDVKPANFLFDPRTGIGTLCDFGLASRMSSKPSAAYGQCLHSGWSEQSPHGHNKCLSDEEKENIRKLQKDARNKCLGPTEKVGYPEKDARPISKANRAGTRGFRAPEVLFKCNEQTGAIDVWAVGIILMFFLSGKFPLFASNDDVEALMEIAAIIGRRAMEKSATLHGRLFLSNVPSVLHDGITWREFVEKLNPDVYKPREPDLRYFPYNTPAYRIYLQEEAERQRNNSSSPTSSTVVDPKSDRVSPPTSATIASTTTSHLSRLSYSLFSAEQHASDVDSAFDLLEQLLHPESTKRITPKRALSHPFLAGKPGEEDALPNDDEFVPHEFGKGVCGKLHYRNERTREMGVKVKVRCECGVCGGVEKFEKRSLVPGEGVAIGREPCEFHDVDLEF
ncbi:hypothetical protein Agabi119p4_4076 [Agaricus bisporus var. burnettii]|uniref:non-specific serine/threonine protein kinase n=1 Tax=Agaricus bisporus var. burnettii TaxID=192524 RepID=A0A8H7KH16_AGABI|nr:hypothetical protein Agabi119p4_4076 [Agaricus bisporus var. burnettii]